MTDASKLGALCKGRPAYCLLVQPGARFVYQLPRDDGSFSGPQNLPRSLERHLQDASMSSNSRCAVLQELLD